MQTLGVIPARGGSQGIPRKNIVDLGGEHLINWTISHAKQAGLNRIIVSTEDNEIAEIVRKNEGVEIFDQPPPMCEGKINAVNVILYVLESLKTKGEKWPEYVFMLLPTSPFRNPIFLIKALKLMLDGAESVIGVCKTQAIPSLRFIRDKYLVPIQNCELNVQSQDVEPVYGVNGAVFLTKSESLWSNRTFHVPGAVPLVMPSICSVDINTEEDLDFARLLVNKVMEEKQEEVDEE